MGYFQIRNMVLHNGVVAAEETYFYIAWTKRSLEMCVWYLFGRLTVLVLVPKKWVSSFVAEQKVLMKEEGSRWVLCRKRPP